MALNAFFYELSPILHLYNAVGGLRFHEEYDKEARTYKVRTKIFAWSTLYSFAALCLQYYFVIKIAIKCSDNFVRMDEGNKLNGIVFSFNIFAPMVLPIVVLLQNRRVSHQMEFWFQLQRKVKALSVRGVDFNLGIRNWCRGAMFCTVLLGLMMALSNTLLSGQLPEALDVIQALGGFYGCMMFSVYYATSKASWRVSHRVLEDYKELLVLNLKGKSTEKLDHIEKRDPF
ncbi:uncharacterized protein LOC132198272 [Neocloeon triangulifer]|uniref:uncharacterized protein LOC132198272 n=1 Tax=Neocloeon triangulifer TaxID=2078957 RepID=UPI00286EE3C6|nr:uncharacterized protein LOC132198272 [Neocloeon triangulifer]